MKKQSKFLVILSVFLSIVLLPFKGYALDNESEDINYLSNDDMYILYLQGFLKEVIKWVVSRNLVLVI